MLTVPVIRQLQAALVWTILNRNYAVENGENAENTAVNGKLDDLLHTNSVTGRE